MTIDWASFTPWASLAGGLLIGLGAAMLCLLAGRVAGISGILGGLVRAVETKGAPSNGRVGDIGWRLAFVAGLVIAPVLYALVRSVPYARIDAGPVTLAIAGLVVGIGTRYGAGCTSGHGVCGLARLSLRSLVATLAFMGAGFATVFVVRHVIGGAA